MHQGMGGDFFLRGILIMAAAVALASALWFSMITVAGLLLNQWSLEGPFYWLFYPLMLWIVAAWLTAVRFLGYLDLRIRREGWEVELLMRAEASSLGKAGRMSDLNDSQTAVDAGQQALNKSWSGYPWYDAKTDSLRQMTIEPNEPPPDDHDARGRLISASPNTLSGSRWWSRLPSFCIS